MFAISFLNKLALTSLLLFSVSTGIYADEEKEERGNTDFAARAGDRGIRNDGINRDQRSLNHGYPYGYGGAYGGYGGAYGGAAYPPPVYPYPYYYGPPSNAEAFPNATEFQNTYERNAHPPR